MHSDRRQVSVLQRWFDAGVAGAGRGAPAGDQPGRAVDAADAARPAAGGLRPVVAAVVRLRRRPAAGRGARGGRAASRGRRSSRATAAPSPARWCRRRRPTDHRPGSVGKPMPHAEVAILDADGNPLPAGEEGEICVRGAGVMSGYWHDPELTARTVRGRLAAHRRHRPPRRGRLSSTIVDRMKDLIIRGGFNVYPRDVEDVLLEHPAVQVAASSAGPTRSAARRWSRSSRWRRATSDRRRAGRVRQGPAGEAQVPARGGRAGRRAAHQRRQDRPEGRARPVRRARHPSRACPRRISCARGRNP